MCACRAGAGTGPHRRGAAEFAATMGYGYALIRAIDRRLHVFNTAIVFEFLTF
jgi:hypothetical protein